jgi:hypothetical protein
MTTILQVLGLLVAMVNSLQLLTVESSPSTGIQHYNQSLGMDFTVYTPIDITAVGIIDAENRGLVGTLSVRIINRSNENQSTVYDPVSFQSPMSRTDDTNLFIFQNVSWRLQIGAYMMISGGFSTNDGFVRTNLGGNVSLVQSRALKVGFSSYGGGTPPTTIDTIYTYGAATFQFTVVNETATHHCRRASLRVANRWRAQAAILASTTLEDNCATVMQMVGCDYGVPRTRPAKRMAGPRRATPPLPLQFPIRLVVDRRTSLVQA